jgi:hypothetical protein
MDLQLKKIHFVQEFLRLDNEKIIDKLELLLEKEKKKLYKQEIKPMNWDQLNFLIEKAENDALSNKGKNVRQLIQDVDSWI